ncbi:MAG: hypothetical protein QM520_03095, partial [Gammaproteobacteria bacterium]|nr:hypothetical protein [Gammaproteobacteria bacterium]
TDSTRSPIQNCTTYTLSSGIINGTEPATQLNYNKLIFAGDYYPTPAVHRYWGQTVYDFMRSLGGW